ncbi:hypothetical protein CO154_02505, partial [Candidatus Pacearchaeota archaeon CG_4_9_14_3_um_filter_31_7]
MAWNEKILDKFADVLIKHSFERVDFRKEWETKRKRLLITYWPPAEPLAKVICQKIWKLGGNILLDLRPEWFERDFFKYASDKVIDAPASLYEKTKVQHAAARLVILSDENTKSLARIDHSKRARRAKASKSLQEMIMKMDEKGIYLLPWCITIFPTHAFAQDSDMSIDEFSNYLEKIMFLHKKDPIKFWKNEKLKQEKFIEKYLKNAKKLRIKHKDGSDLVMNVSNHLWIPCYGDENFPDGEIFNAPHKNSVSGTIKFLKLPQCDHGGPEVKGIVIKLKNGKVINYKAETGQSYLKNFFENNPEAKSIGEISFGLNPNVNFISKEILLDEKMGGAIHMAFGRAYKNHILKGSR